MARRLALGCKVVGYGYEPRTCCGETCFSGCKAPESVSLSGSVAFTVGACAFPVFDGTYDTSLFTHPGGDGWGALGGADCDYLYYLFNGTTPCPDTYITVVFRLLHYDRFHTPGYLKAQVHYGAASNNSHALWNYSYALPNVGCPTGSIQIPYVSGGAYNLTGPPPWLLAAAVAPDVYLNFT